MARNPQVVIKKNEFKRLAKLAPKEADKVVAALALRGDEIVKDLWLNSPADGESYRRGGRTHTASSAGNPSRVDSGVLIGSTKPDKIRQKVHRIVSEAEHAVHQEFGVPENGLAARPAHGPMAMQLEDEIPDYFDKFLEDKV